MIEKIKKKNSKFEQQKEQKKAVQLQIKQMKDLLILEKKNIVDEIKGLRKQFKLKEMEDSKAMMQFHQHNQQSLEQLKR